MTEGQLNAKLMQELELMEQGQAVFGVEFPVSVDFLKTKKEEMKLDSPEIESLYSKLLQERNNTMFFTENIKARPEAELVECWNCDGRGTMMEVTKSSMNIYKCDVCRGRGKMPIDYAKQTIENTKPIKVDNLSKGPAKYEETIK